MKAIEVGQQLTRIELFRKLEARQEQIRAALRVLQEPCPDGPCGQNPFTGNWRESRDVEEIKMFFTKTKGGSPEVHATIEHLLVSASALKNFLVAELSRQYDQNMIEMEKI